MIDEQAGQSTPAPRQWRHGDAEPPADVTLVRYERELPHPFLRRSDLNDFSGEGMWVLESSADPDTWSPGAGWPWSRRIEWTKTWGPLTEVVPPSSVSPSGENTTPVGEDTGEESSAVQATSEAWTPHTAITVGIKRGLADFGAELTGCTAAALTGHVINQLREAGLDPSSSETRAHLPADWRTQLHKVEHGAMDSRATAKTVALIESWMAPSPLPSREAEPDAVQWGYREYEGEIVEPVLEKYARFRAQDDHLKLVQREVRYGPWVVVDHG